MPMQKKQRVTERGTEMGLCVVSRARQINSSVFQKTVTSISLTANSVRWEDPKTQCLFFLWLMRHTGKCAQSRPSEICEKNFFFFIAVVDHFRYVFANIRAQYSDFFALTPKKTPFWLCCLHGECQQNMLFMWPASDSESNPCIFCVLDVQSQQLIYVVVFGHAKFRKCVPRFPVLSLDLSICMICDRFVRQGEGRYNLCQRSILWWCWGAVRFTSLLLPWGLLFVEAPGPGTV